MAILDFDCGEALCLGPGPMPVSVAFLPYDATVQTVRSAPTYRVQRKGSGLRATRETSLSFSFEELLDIALGPTFLQPGHTFGSPPIVCGRVPAIFCAQAISQALAAYPSGLSADGFAAEYTCPPGAFCSALTTYVVAFLESGPSTVAPWPPTYFVRPKFGGLRARTTPWPVGEGLDDYVTAVIREAGWVPAP